ncbi:hypothetical protein GT354_13395, partial [Streptomyces sp. SID3343]|nr:hypothetical protein [Streptomyces sp. SID3343]
VAAQVDARLPRGQVVVADGVHRDVPGPAVRDAYRAARAGSPRLGLPMFLATPELPDPLPPELAEPPGDSPALRLLLGGPGRGHVRTLLTDVHGQVAVPGTPLVAVCNALGAALAEVLPSIPPVLPPVPAPVSRAGAGQAEWFVEEGHGATAPRPRAVPVATAQPSGTAEPVAPAEPAGATASALSAELAVAEPPSRSAGGSAAPATSQPSSARSTPAGSAAAGTGPEPLPSVAEPTLEPHPRTSTAPRAPEHTDHEEPAAPAVSARREPVAAPPDPAGGPARAPAADPNAEPEPAPQPDPTPDTEPTDEPTP